MSKVKCRCGNDVIFEPAPGVDTVKVLCHRCGSRIRVHLNPAAKKSADSGNRDDGFVRFFCPCGRRLKVIAMDSMPSHGRCPDCGRTVPVPAQQAARSPDPHEAPTGELTTDEIKAVTEWKAKFSS